jgi:hypothetical protein
VRQDRAVAAHRLRAFDLAVRRHGPQAQFAALDADAAELRDALKGEQRRRLHQPLVHEDAEEASARDHGRVVAPLGA